MNLTHKTFKITSSGKKRSRSTGPYFVQMFALKTMSLKKIKHLMIKVKSRRGNYYCHSATQPQHELELDLIMVRNPPPPPPRNFKATLRQTRKLIENDFKTNEKWKTTSKKQKQKQKTTSKTKIEDDLNFFFDKLE